MGQLLTDSNRAPAGPPGPSGYLGAILLDSPSALYPMDDAAGAVLADYFGNANGVITNSGDITFHEPTLTSSGAFSMRSTGTDPGNVAEISANSHITVDNAVGFTIESLIKLNSYTTTSAGALFYARSTGPGYLMQLDGTGKNIGQHFDSTAAAVTLFGVTPLSLGAVHHVAYSVDFVALTATLYLDGAVDATVALANQGGIPATLLRLLNQTNATTFQNDGWLQYMALYQHPLSGAQIAAHNAAK